MRALAREKARFPMDAQEIYSAGERARGRAAKDSIVWSPLLVEGADIVWTMSKMKSIHPWLPDMEIEVLASRPFCDGCVFIFRPLHSQRGAFYSIAFYSLSSRRFKAHVGAFYRASDAVEDIEALTGLRLGESVEPSSIAS